MELRRGDGGTRGAEEADLLRVDRDGSVLRLELDRPEKRNALNSALIAALRDALAEADADDTVHVITVAGAGKDFCAGADLSSLRRLAQADVLENLADVDELAGLFLAMRKVRKPVVALVKGRALAGGCGLATACDLVLAEESARFAYSEVRIGFVPAMVMSILHRNVSEKRAFEMIVTGATYTATEAERMGLINRVFPDGAFDEEAAAFVAEIAARSPSAVRLSKRLFYLQDGMTFETALRTGADLNVLARMTEDTRAGIERFLGSRGGGEEPAGS